MSTRSSGVYDCSLVFTCVYVHVYLDELQVRRALATVLIFSFLIMMLLVSLALDYISRLLDFPSLLLSPPSEWNELAEILFSSDCAFVRLYVWSELINQIVGALIANTGWAS